MMETTKYTYQDWVEGKWFDDTCRPANNIIGLILFGKISEDDASKILTEQNAAYLKFLSVAFERFKLDFMLKYDDSLLQEEFLNYNIQGLEKFLDEVRTAHEMMVRYALQDNDGRFHLSKAEVDKYNTAELDDKQMDKALMNYLSEIEGEYNIDDEQTPIMYILKVNFYKWLVWFREQEGKKNNEPKINLPTNSGGTINQLLRARIDYTWPNLFKDSKQADKLLDLLSEYLSDTGQWNTGNTGRHLMALYSELRQKGYLKTTLTAPIIADAFNAQFDTNLTSKNFQPGELQKAEGYREYFKYIPQYKPDSTP